MNCGLSTILCRRASAVTQTWAAGEVERLRPDNRTIPATNGNGSSNILQKLNGIMYILLLNVEMLFIWTLNFNY